VVRSPSSARVILGTLLLCAGCTAAIPSGEATQQAVRATATSAQTTAPTVAPTPAVTPAPTLPPTGVEHLTETIDLSKFSAPTMVTNAWFPLAPGQHWIYTGAATIDGERLSRKVELTITDLTKEIGGVRSVVAYELDYTDGILGEAEIVLWAQDDDGVVWRMGEYPEVYEDGELVETPVWIHGFEGALAGIAMQPEPQPYTPSYAQGWGPAVEWNDRGRIFEVGSLTCVKAGCFKDVLVIDEFSRDEPDAHQLKYYARGFGNVRVGWAGAREQEQEVLGLVKFEMLSAAALGRVRTATLAQDARGYTTSPKVYGQTEPAQPPAA
jgi:hypothetical protein